MFLAPASASFAAGIAFSAEQTTVAKDGTFTANVLFDAGPEAINAIEGSISYPANLLDIILINDGNSSLNLWVETPHETERGIISFSGITPGGFTGDGNHLFSVRFRARKTGEGVLSSAQIRALRNDGSGTPIDTTSASIFFSVDKARRGSQEEAAQPEIEDNEPPERFTPVLSRDASLFGGREFVVFSTTDKGSGIAKYQAKKGRLGLWRDATSPHQIERLFKRTRVSVRAIDNSGNVRTEVIMPSKPASRTVIHIFIVLAALAGAILYFATRRRTR